MVRPTLLIAGLLVLLGVVFYFITNMVSATALIPAALGVLLAVCAAIVAAKPDLRKHVMHVAMLLGLLGIIVPAIRLPVSIAHGKTGVWVELILMIVLCVIFLVLGIRSFIMARRASADEATPSA